MRGLCVGYGGVRGQERTSVQLAVCSRSARARAWHSGTVWLLTVGGGRLQGSDSSELHWATGRGQRGSRVRERHAGHPAQPQCASRYSRSRQRGLLHHYPPWAKDMTLGLTEAC